MPCGCKHKKRSKRGSGNRYLSGATYKPGSGLNFRGGGLKKKRRKKGSGVSFAGGGVNFSGGGYVFDGSGWKPIVKRRSK